MEVGPKTLRGFGTSIPLPLAALLGVKPGERRSFAAEEGKACVSWPETSPTGPMLNTIRLLVERVQGQRDDSLLLVFRRDQHTVDLTRIDPIAVNSAQGLQRLSLLTGVSRRAGEKAFVRDLAFALATSGTLAAIRTKLQERGEADLAAVLPAENGSPERGAALGEAKDR